MMMYLLDLAAEEEDTAQIPASTDDLKTKWGK